MGITGDATAEGAKSDGKPALLSRISTITEVSPFANVCLYGPAGVGKTVDACRAPKPLLIDTENGYESLINHPELSHVDRFQVERASEVEELLWEAKSGNLKQYETIIIDNGTELTKRKIDDKLRDRHQINAQSNAYLPQGQDYQENGEYFRRLFMGFRDLPFHHFVLVLHSEEEKEEATGIFKIRPGLTPKLAKTLEGMMGVIGYMTRWVETVDDQAVWKRGVQIQPANNIVAKSRIGGLPPVVEVPFVSTAIAQQQANYKRMKENPK